jgi:hypothetical protein
MSMLRPLNAGWVGDAVVRQPPVTTDKARQESVDGEVWTGQNLEKKKFIIKQKIRVTVER